MKQKDTIDHFDLSAARTPWLRAAQDVLVKTHELLEKPEAWNQRSLARDADGNGTPCTSGFAVSWCVSGALVAVTERERVDSETHNIAHEAVRQNLPKGHRSLHMWNDAPERTHADVRRILREGAQTLQSHIDARPA